MGNLIHHQDKTREVDPQYQIKVAFTSKYNPIGMVKGVSPSDQRGRNSQ